MKLTIIGAGNMGGALAKGWVKAVRNGQAELDITITAKTQKTLDSFADFPEIHTSLDNISAVQTANIVVLAVKPWLIDSVVSELGSNLDGKIVVSVAAKAKNPAIMIYAMPNIAAEYGDSMTFVQQGDSQAITEKVAALFSLVGKTQVVEERLMGAGMMMAGCGIAYVMRMVRAMMEGGVEMGFYPKVSKEIALQTMKGAVALLEETGLHPEEAIDRVTTPGGVTIKGLNELDHSGFNSAVIRCLKAGL